MHRIVDVTFCAGPVRRPRAPTCPFPAAEHSAAEHVVAVCSCGVFYAWCPTDEAARDRVLADVRAADAADAGRAGHALAGRAATFR